MSTPTDTDAATIGTFVLHLGDCLTVMRGMADNSVDSVVTDPPYDLTSQDKRDYRRGYPHREEDGEWSPAKRRGFMGKEWDGTGIAFRVELWKEVLRVLKPGGHLAAFGGTRTYHRMAVAIEDAGFEIRDSLHWIYGSGFPKSLDVSKAIDRAAGAEREVVGIERRLNEPSGIVNAGRGENARTLIDREITVAATLEAQEWQGWGTALKPAHEPIVLARKPLSERTVASNVLRWGTGAINVDAGRVGTSAHSPQVTGVMKGNGNNVYREYDPAGEGGGKILTEGRWPANILIGHAPSCNGICAPGCPVPQLDGYFANFEAEIIPFYYSGKATTDERNDGCDSLPSLPPGGLAGRHDGSLGSVTYNRNTHPTVKPVKLMRWLCKLITPPGGLILDPFLGSGTTGVAAITEGFRFVGIEREAEYMTICEKRIEHAASQGRQTSFLEAIA